MMILLFNAKVANSCGNNALKVSRWRKGANMLNCVYNSIAVNHSFFARDSIYAIARICDRNSVCLDVWTSGRLSVTRVDCTKTVEARIVKLTPQGSPMTLVFPC